MNRELLIRVRDQILAEPKKCDMSTWETRSGPTRIAGMLLGKGRDCGTARCIAGWTIQLSSGDVHGIDGNDAVFAAAMELLGITKEDAKPLFYLHEHTATGGTKYEKIGRKLAAFPSGSKEYAKIVAEAIDLCLADYPAVDAFARAMHISVED